MAKITDYPIGKQLILLVAAALTACSLNTLETEPKDGPPTEQRDITAIPNAVPKHEPKARYGNHSPYQVFGKTYHVLPSAEGYSEEGIASWYGEKFKNRPTSTLEPYDPYAMTAAHKSLPLPCYVKVTNLENGKEVIVRVNDRGPFHDDRIIDLSYAAAQKLGYAHKGTARVAVTVVTPESLATDSSNLPNSQSKQPTPVPQGEDKPGHTTLTYARSAQEEPITTPADSTQKLFLQAGAFSTIDAAHRMATSLRALTGRTVNIQSDPEKNLHRVWVGPFSAKHEALKVQTLIADSQMAKPLLIQR